MRHLMSPLDFSVEELDKLLDLANDIEAHPEKYAHKCDGKKLATCFYEPSTRTRLSFEAAMLNLGGSVLGFHSADSSSAAKGESVSDTIRVISCYADICAMRHPKEGAPLVASEKSRIPVINAGDGGHQHPTQTLADLLTIRSIKGRLNNITIGFCGDLKFGRTVHSLINALIRYDNVRIVLISPEELKVLQPVMRYIHMVTPSFRESAAPALYAHVRSGKRHYQRAFGVHQARRHALAVALEQLRRGQVGRDERMAARAYALVEQREQHLHRHVAVYGLAPQIVYYQHIACEHHVERLAVLAHYAFAHGAEHAVGGQVAHAHAACVEPVGHAVEQERLAQPRVAGKQQVAAPVFREVVAVAQAYVARAQHVVALRV